MEALILHSFKICTKCKENKPATNKYFYKMGGKKGENLRHACKTCCNKQSNKIEKARRKVDAEYKEYLDKRHKAYSKTPQGISTRIKSLLKKYDMTIEDYNQLFDKQNGKCDICKIHQSQLNKRLFVDHCHATGKVRGLLCSKCNHGIGLLNEDITIMLEAMEYVKRHK